jgi:hypothetical protein
MGGIYPKLVPVVTEGNEWAKSVTFFSMDKTGQADWFHHLASDIRIADVMRNKYEVGLEMAGIGYRYSLEELGQAMMIPNLNLTVERADAARRAAEEFLNQVALYGDTVKGWTGLLNDTNVSQGYAIADGTGSSRLWSTKTGDQMVRDVNSVLTSVYTVSLTIETANTVLMDPAHFTQMANTRLPNTTMNALEWLRQYNAYTALTQQPLTIMAARGLETAGLGGTSRLMAYRRDPQIVKFHLPMPHHYLPVWQTAPIVYDRVTHPVTPCNSPIVAEINTMKSIYYLGVTGCNDQK